MLTWRRTMSLSELTPAQEAEEEAIQLWIDGRISENEFYQRLRALGFADYEIQYMIWLNNG